MLKVRGKQQEINKLLQIIEEEQKRNNAAIVEFDDLSTEQDKNKGISDLFTEHNFTFDFAKRLSDAFPEIKMYGVMHDIANHRTIDYWSKPGSSHMNKVINDVYSPNVIFENWEAWWNKDDLYYVEQKEDGTLSITGYYRWDEELYIPERINGKEVTELSDNLFLMNPAVKDIYVGENIRALGTSTFSSCKKLLLHTDNRIIIDTLRNTRVMIVTSDDTDEVIDIKRDFVYKSSSKGITVYSYRGSSENVTVPDKIGSVPVNKLANKAFSGFNLKMLTIPASINKFVPEIFEKADIDCLVAPGIDIITVKSPVWKKTLAKGYVMRNQDGVYTDKKIVDGYQAYLKRSFDTFVEPCMDSMELLYHMLKTIKLTPKNYEALMQAAADKDSLEAKTLLLDYKNNNISEEQMAKYEMAKVTKALSGPTLTELRKEWSYDILNENTVRLTSYKGSDENVIVPAEIDGRKVVSLGKTTFVAVFTDIDNEQLIKIKQRRRVIKTISIHSGIKEIGEMAFVGCGNASVPTNRASWSYLTPQTKASYPPMVTLLVESGSFAEEFAKKEGIVYRTSE